MLFVPISIFIIIKYLQMASYPVLFLVAISSIIIWKIFLSFFLECFIAGYRLGFNKIAIIYKPLSTYLTIYQQSAAKYGHSYGYLHQKVKKNPDVKIIFLRVFGITHLNVVDPELFRKLSFDYVANLKKRQLLIFYSQLQKGLLFSEGQQWKKSRRLLSNLFHFDLLETRSDIMQDVIKKKIGNLSEEYPNLLKLGCSISGEIVLKSLFGEDFFNLDFNGKTPYEQVNQIMGQLIITSRKLPNLVRTLFGRKANRHSLFLTRSERSCLNRLIQFKQKCKCFLGDQLQKYKQGKIVTNFLKAYFDIQQTDNFEEVVQQLYIFLLAGEDTTGGLISYCLYYLAKYPKYQQSILEDTQKAGIHNSKQLSNFINEVNRKCAPVQNALSRIVDGYKFVKNTVISLSFVCAMNNQKYWDNPNEFQPERFNKALEYPIAFIPFSSGPRNCIGKHMALMQIRLILVRTLEKYRLQLDGVANTIINKGVVTVLKNLNCVKFIDK